MDRRICELFFFWSVFNVFLGAMFGGAIFSQLAQSIKDPGDTDVQAVVTVMRHMDEILFWRSAYLHCSYACIGRLQ